ncbi:hypothetical protein [Xanthobacter flavus]|uniref:hypothetical protein n=1 Tax=Xanthobacter flavus TaxID=281 RepID=UPI003727F60B
MGFNTVAMILTDRLHDIKASSDFGARVYNAAIRFTWGEAHRDFLRFREGCIISQAHADTWQPVVVGKNAGYSLWADEVPLEALEAVARALRDKGYRVTKPKAAPAQREEAP